MKRILPHLASNGQFIRMFLDEARLASLLDHPNIVRIIEVGHDGEDYFLAMELVQGKPLSALLRKAAREHRPPSPALTSYIVAQAASGLAYAHALTDGDGRTLGIVHRDVSPQNILISFEGAVKLIDFGVARAFGRVAHTNPGGLKGKIDYMSPEQASAEDVDHRADVFALGVVLWEAVTGKRLFRRDTELATMRAIVDDPIPHPSEVAEVPAELDAIVMRALRKRRDARFASAHEMAVALERFAFTHDGFSPLQVAAYTKSLFARRIPAVAQDRDQRAGPGGRAVADPGAGRAGRRAGDRRADDGAAAGRVVGRRAQRAAQRLGTQPQLAEQAARAGAAVAGVERPAPATSRRDRIWVYGGLTILASVMVAGAWLLARPAEMAGAGSAPAPVETASRTRGRRAAAARDAVTRRRAGADPGGGAVPDQPADRSGRHDRGHRRPCYRGRRRQGGCSRRPPTRRRGGRCREPGKAKRAARAAPHREKPPRRRIRDAKGQSADDALPGSKKPDPFAD